MMDYGPRTVRVHGEEILRAVDLDEEASRDNLLAVDGWQTGRGRDLGSQARRLVQHLF